jgi:hypothetical protein
MISHLSSEQISKVLADKATAEETLHANECVECRTELTRLRETLSLFRDSVLEWANENHRSAPSSVAFLRAEKSAYSRQPLRWALITALLILFVAVPLYRSVSDHHRETDAEDSLLLEQVNAHLSRTVPAPMEPLMQLLSDSSVNEVGGR